MVDLISRADAIEAVCDGCVWYKTASCEEGKEEWECSEVNKIRHLPSVDAELVVRCKDCKHGEKQKTYEEVKFYSCDFSETEEWFTEDFFCANGERREP